MERNQIIDFVKNRFANIRLGHALSARELSAELGQSSTYISQIENGHKLPSLEVLYYFCEYFKMPLSEFFADEWKYPVQYKTLFHDLGKLDTDELYQVMSLAKLFARNKKQ